MLGIAAITSKRFQENLNAFGNSSESDEQKNKWILSERDIAFLVAQTGKYKYLFYVNFIKFRVFFFMNNWISQLLILFKR